MASISSDGPNRPPESAKSVLAYDDERHILRLIEANLQRQGYEVVCCESSLECLSLLSERTFDILVVRPERKDVLQAVAADERHAEMTILPLPIQK